MRAIFRSRGDFVFLSTIAAAILLLSACTSSPDQAAAAASPAASAAEEEDAADPRGEEDPSSADSGKESAAGVGADDADEDGNDDVVLSDDPDVVPHEEGEEGAAAVPAGEPSDARAGTFADDEERSGAGDLPVPGDDEAVGDGSGDGSTAGPPVNPLLTDDRPYEEPDGVEIDETAGETSPTAGNEASGGGTGGPTDSGIAVGPSGTEAPGNSIAGSDSGDGADLEANEARENRAETAEPESRAGGTVRTAAASPGDAGPDARHPALAAEAPDRRLDEPGEITIVLEGQGWVFRSDLSTPGSWRFLDRERDGDSTRFLFEFDERGRWNLVFERQDLSSGGSERTVRSVSVGEAGTAVASGNGGSIAADRAEESAEEAASAGRIGEALEILEREALEDGESGRRARSELMELAAKSGSTAPLVTWLPAYLEDGADAGVLESALAVLEGNAGYSEESRMILEELSETDRGERTPEWLYKLALSLEKPGEGRDMDRAARLYDEVIRNWPLTEWRDLSEERLAWLQRHYFRVR